MDEGELSILQQLGKPAERRVEGDAVVDLVQSLGGRQIDAGPMLLVEVVLVGDDGVEAVVAAVELDDDEHVALVRFRLRGQDGGGAGQEGRHGIAAR